MENKPAIKKVIVNGIPRQAVLKPSHAVYRLQSQHFYLGDRVVMVQDSGSVPLSMKGVVIGINAKTMDVVWDVSFMAGSTLGDRCSLYRGSSVEFNSCLNLSNPQLIISTNPKAPQAQQQPQNGAFKPRLGPRPNVQPAPGQQPASGFRPATNKFVPFTCLLAAQLTCLLQPRKRCANHGQSKPRSRRVHKWAWGSCKSTRTGSPHLQ